MTAKLENEYGVISIDHEVIARIAGYAAIECYGTVSYTHLDVYKRQLYGYPLYGNVFGNSGLFPSYVFDGYFHLF